MANSQGKRRINFLDFLLIILIIATVSAAIVSVIRSNPNQISGGDTEIIFTIKCDMVDKEAAANINIDDRIYDNNTNQLLGKITSITISDIVAKNTDVPTGKVAVKIDIKAAVWKNKGIYSIDSYRIAEGVTVSFHSSDFSYTGDCVKVLEIKEGAANEQ